MQEGRGGFPSASGLVERRFVETERVVLFVQTVTVHKSSGLMLDACRDTERGRGSVSCHSLTFDFSVCVFYIFTEIESTLTLKLQDLLCMTKTKTPPGGASET